MRQWFSRGAATAWGVGPHPPLASTIDMRTKAPMTRRAISRTGTARAAAILVAAAGVMGMALTEEVIRMAMPLMERRVLSRARVKGRAGARDWRETCLTQNSFRLSRRVALDWVGATASEV